MKRGRGDAIYIQDMLTAIGRILDYTANLNYDQFFFDNKTIDAVVRNMEVLGEASSKMSKELKSKYTDFPWDQMYFMRNKMIHEYFGIDLEIIWDIIKNHLPNNKEQLKNIFEKER
jgi:uncharacterized protein with HEPN domain